jgi:hypothetical protein
MGLVRVQILAAPSPQALQCRPAPQPTSLEHVSPTCAAIAGANSTAAKRNRRAPAGGMDMDAKKLYFPSCWWLVTWDEMQKTRKKDGWLANEGTTRDGRLETWIKSI